jgi:anti-sigma factor RsiW
MKCEEVSQGLIAYLDGRSSVGERQGIEQHIAECAACWTRAEEFRRVSSLLDEVPAIEPSLGFNAAVRRRIAAEPKRRWFEGVIPQPRLVLAAALLILLTVFVVKLPLSKPVPAPAQASEQDFNAIKNLRVLENYDVVTGMDALSQLAPDNSSQPSQQPAGNGADSND